MNATQPYEGPPSPSGDVDDLPQVSFPTASAHARSPRRGWLPMIAAGLLGAVLGGVVVYAVTAVGPPGDAEPAATEAPKHTATAWLRVGPQQVLVFRTMDRDPPDDLEVYQGAQAQLLKSRLVLGAALRQPEIARLPVIREQADAVDWLAGQIEVNFPGKAEIMEVSLGGDDAEAAAAVVNAVVDAYLAVAVEAQRDRRAERLSKLREVYAARESELRKKRGDLKRLAEQLATSDTSSPSLKQQIAVQDFAQSQRELAAVRSDLRQARTELKIEEALASDPDRLAVSQSELDAFVQSDAAANQLLMQWDQIVQYLSDVEATTKAPVKAQYTEKLERDLKAVQEQYDARRAELLDGLRRRAQATARADIERLRVKIAVLSEEKLQLENSFQQQAKQIEDLARPSVEVEIMRAELETAAKVLAGIAEEREMLRVEIESAPRVELLERAEVSAAK